MKKSKEIYLYGIASLINDIASDLASSALPFFIMSLGGTSSIVTFIMGLKEALPEILKPLAGYLSDRIGKKKPFVVFGYVFSSLSRIALAMSQTVNQVVGSIFLDRLGKGIRDTPRDVLISHLDGSKGMLYGIHKSMDTFGALVGSLLGVYLATMMLPREVMYVAAAIGVFSFIPLLWVHERKAPKIKPKWVFSWKILPLMLLAATATNVGLPISLLSETFEESVIMYLVFNLTYIVFSPLIGKLSDKKGFKKAFLFGFSASAATYGFLMVGAGFFAMASMGIVFAVIGSAGRSFIAHISQKGGEPGTEMGILSASVGLASLVGSTAASLMVAYSPSMVAPLYIILSLVSILAFR